MASRRLAGRVIMHTMVKALPHKLLDADKTWFSSLKIT